MKPNILKLVANGFYREALSIYSNHNSASKRRQRFTFPPILKACGKLGLSSHGKSLHTQLLKAGFLSDHYSATALTAMYSNFRLLGDALKVFDEMPHRTLASLNAVVSGLAHNGHLREAFAIFMTNRFRPNSVTLASFLSSCESLDFAETIHCWAVKLGFDKDVFLATAILSVYSKSRRDSEEPVVLALSKVFKDIKDKNLVSYNAHLSALLRSGQNLEVLAVFKDMMTGFDPKPNSVTLVSAISACSRLPWVPLCGLFHALAIKLGHMFDVTVGTSLVHMYSKFGLCQDSYETFDELKDVRNWATWNSVIPGMMSNGDVKAALALFGSIITTVDGSEKTDIAIWNSMIRGLSRLGRAAEARYWFRKMLLYGVSPDRKLLTSALSAWYSDPPSLRSGKEIHGHATRILVPGDVILATALVELYMKSGLSCWARKVFDGFGAKSPKDPAIWNAMISGFGRNGDFESALEMFDRMLENKVKPNDATFMSVLSACAHTGRVNKGLEIFRLMSTEFGLRPKPKHFSCVVDLLGRCGRLNDARELVRELPEPSKSVFATLLGACSWNSDPDLGEEMAKKLLELDPKNPMPYVVLSNIYAEQGRWRDAERIRMIIDCKGHKKVPGFSYIEVS